MRLSVFRSCPLIPPKDPRQSLQTLAIARAMAKLCAWIDHLLARCPVTPENPPPLTTQTVPQRFICTVPLTFTNTVPLPGSTGSASSDDTAIAFICIGTPRGGICSFAFTLTSRIA